MAYRAFDEWPLAALSDRPLNAAPIRTEVPLFDALELQVIALAREDGARSIRPRDWSMRLSERLFGFRRANPLANPRLEALRRFAVAARLSRGRRFDREAANFLSAGFTPLQARFVEHRASLALSFPRKV